MKATSKPRTQTERTFEYMQRNEGITSYEAFVNLGITRLSARIWDLRHEGYRIDTESVTQNGQTFKRYNLEEIQG